MTIESSVMSKSVQKVAHALAEKGIVFEIVEFPASTRTASDAAAAIGCEVAHIMKSLLFCGAQTKEPVLVLASGVNRVNEKKIEVLVGEKIVKADADFTREVTGFAIGGVPPIGHSQPITHVFLDEDLLQYEVVWAAAGTPHTVFSLKVSDVEVLIQGKRVNIK